MLVRKSGPKGHDTLKLGLDALNGRLFKKFSSSSKSLELWLNLLWMWSPQHIFTSCGIVLLYPLLSQVGGLCQRDPLSLYLFIWNDYPFFWKRRFRTKLSILSRLGVKLKCRIYSLLMISFFSPRWILQSAIILKTFYINSIIALAKSLVHKNHVSGFHQIRPDELKIWLLVFLIFLPWLNSEPT